VKKACFADAVSGQNLGSQFTSETLGKLKLWILKYHVSGFQDGAPLGWRTTMWDMRPVDLQFTVGYKNPTMVGFLREQGAYKEVRDRRASGRRSAAAVPGTARRGSDRSRELRVRPAGVREARGVVRGGSRGGRARGGASSGSGGRSSSGNYSGGSTSSSGRSGSSSGGELSGGSSRGRNMSGGSYSGYAARNFSSDSSGSYRSSVSTDSVFAGGSRMERPHSEQLVAELESLRLSRCRMEREGDRRVERERERAERLEAALEKTRSELAELKRDHHNLKLDNERLLYNHNEAWSIIRAEWKKRDLEQERRERRN
jgi:hypothetical protein